MLHDECEPGCREWQENASKPGVSNVHMLLQGCPPLSAAMSGVSAALTGVSAAIRGCKKIPKPA